MDPDGVVRLVGAILSGARSCRDHDPRLFDPDRLDEGDPAARMQRRELAREICDECPERAPVPDLRKRRS